MTVFHLCMLVWLVDGLAAAIVAALPSSHSPEDLDPELGDRAARVLLRPAQNYAACAARVTSHPFGSHPFALGAPRLDGLLFLGNLRKYSDE